MYGLDTCGRIGQEAVRRDLCPRVSWAPVMCENAHKAQAPSPLGRQSWRRLRPSERQLVSNIGCFALLHEANKVSQSSPVLSDVESHTTAQSQVVLHSLSKCVHSAPPGQRNASVRNAGISTFA